MSRQSWKWKAKIHKYAAKVCLIRNASVMQGIVKAIQIIKLA
jgi:hypothetical protein